MPTFPYTDAELLALRDKDAVLADYIDRVGRIEREIVPDLFAGLVRSIVAQQISSAALKTILARMSDLLCEFTPERVLAAGPEAIQRCGLSMKKAGYIHTAAQCVACGSLDLAALNGLPDEQVIASLVTLPGIGEWTAEMLLIFSLCRRNVLSRKDLGIDRGIRRLYGVEGVSNEMFETLRARFSPYASIASLYLWDAAKPA